MGWSGERSGFRTCTVLLKMSIVDLGTHTAGGKNVTNTHKTPEKESMCQGAQTIYEHTTINTDINSVRMKTLHSSVCVYCTRCLSVTCTVCMSLLEKSVHESPLSLARGSAASQLKKDSAS